jgi:uncharacterized protein YndB with AHSA1/START domain
MVGNCEGETFPHTCTITEVIHERKISYTWKIDNEPGETLVTYELEKLNNKTKLTMTHSGWDKFPADTPQEARDGYADGWESIINTYLKDFVENN